jgi:hypothetical protein
MFVPYWWIHLPLIDIQLNRQIRKQRRTFKCYPQRWCATFVVFQDYIIVFIDSKAIMFYVYMLCTLFCLAELSFFDAINYYSLLGGKCDCCPCLARKSLLQICWQSNLPTVCLTSAPLWICLCRKCDRSSAHDWSESRIPLYLGCNVPFTRYWPVE